MAETFTRESLPELYGVSELDVDLLLDEFLLLNRELVDSRDHVEVIALERIATLVYNSGRESIDELPQAEGEAESDHPIMAAISHMRVCEICADAIESFKVFAAPDLSQSRETTVTDQPEQL